MGYPVPERDIAGKEVYAWEDEDACEQCGHGLVWANVEGNCTYTENGVRCACTQHGEPLAKI